MDHKTLINKLDNLLKPLEFARKKSTWNRRTDIYVDVIDLQIGKFGSDVTLNVGVFEPEIYLKCWDHVPKFVHEIDCIVRSRIGGLIDGHDIWWKFEDIHFFEKIVGHIHQYGLPFFSKMHSREAMENFIEASVPAKKKFPPECIYRAILKAQRGDTEAACALLGELENKIRGAWKPRIVELRLELSRTSKRGERDGI